MFFATFIWGSIPLFSIWTNLPSPVFVFFRVLFAFPFIFFYSLRKLGKKELIRIKPAFPLVISGIVLSLNWIFFFWAINLTDITTAVVLYYFGPVFSIILAVVFLKEPLTKTLILATLFAFFGAFLTFLPSFSYSSASFFGSLIALVSGFLYGLLGFISKITTAKHSSLKITVYQIFISLFFTMPFVFFFKFGLNLTVLFLLVITGVVHTALALFLWYDSLNYIKVSTSAVFSYLDPFFAIVLGFLILHQKPSLIQLIGGILIAISGVVVSMEEGK
nr:DMT family transporter [Hippea alviniae]